MTVKKRVVAKIENFIDKGASVKQNKKKIFKNILLRVPEDILLQLNETIEERPWISRNQWIIEAIYKKIKDEENGK